MQCVRRIGLSWAILFCITGISYAASRDSRATLHISVTLVTTIGTSPAKPVKASEVATSENQDIIYNLSPGTGQSVAEAITSNSQTEPQEKSLANFDNPSKEEAVVEVTTVVMK